MKHKTREQRRRKQSALAKLAICLILATAVAIIFAPRAQSEEPLTAESYLQSIGADNATQAQLMQLYKDYIEQLRSKILPEQFEIDSLRAEITSEKSSLEKIKEEVAQAKKELCEISNQIVETNEQVMFQSFGLYTPHYSFMNSDEYKVRLLEIRAQQKDIIKNKEAVTGSKSWTLNGSAAKGKKVIADMQKIIFKSL